MKCSHRNEIEKTENILQILWKGQVYWMLTLQLKKLEFFLMSERELFIITSSCERLRMGDDWCEFMTDNSSLTSHLVVSVSEIFFVQMSVLLLLWILASLLFPLMAIICLASKPDLSRIATAVALIEWFV